MLCLLVSSIVPAQQQYFFYNDGTADALIRHGLETSYNLEYSAASRDWDELIRRYPEHPAGYVYKAALLWWQATEDRGNKDLHAQFESSTKTALDKGLAWIRKNPRDKIGLAYLASAYGDASRFDVTVTRSYLSALRNGKKGFKYIEKAHEIDPNFYDAYIGLGSYNYFTGALPGVIKPFAWLLGARGDKNEGLRQLLLAAERGEYARTEAKIVLLSVYITEKRWMDYEQLLESLMKQYPLNHVFYTWASNHYIGMKRWDAGIATFKGLEKAVASTRSDYTSGSLAWVQYNLGRNYFAKQDWGNALDSLAQAEKMDSKNPVLLAQVYLLKGNTLDVMGRHNEAVTVYERVLQYPSVEDSQSRARRYLKSAYGK